MADYEDVLRVADDGYRNRDDYPPYAVASFDDRPRWREYMMKINAELNEQTLLEEKK